MNEKLPDRIYRIAIGTILLTMPTIKTVQIYSDHVTTPSQHRIYENATEQTFDKIYQERTEEILKEKNRVEELREHLRKTHPRKQIA